MAFSFLNRIRSVTLLAVTLLLLLICLLLTTLNIWNEKKMHGTPDLRNRIIGSRIIKHKETASPYFYKWHQNDGDHFLDPYDSPGVPMNRNTVTPFTLQLLQPICDIEYKHLSIIWYILEVISLLAIAVLLTWLSTGLANKLIVLSISLIGIGISQGWMLHNLSGQVYIFIPLLLSLLLLISRSPTNKGDFLSGIILSVVFLFRPNTLLFVLPFLLLKKLKPIFYALILIAIYFGLLYMADEIWMWHDYFRAVNLWAEESANNSDTKSYMQLLNIKQIEGSTTFSQPPALVLLEDTSIVSLFKRFLGITLTRVQLIVIMLCGFGSLILLLHKKIRLYNLNNLFVLAFLLYFLSELCIPAIRNSYNAVQWVFPLAILYLDKKRASTRTKSQLS